MARQNCRACPANMARVWHCGHRNNQRLRACWPTTAIMGSGAQHPKAWHIDRLQEDATLTGDEFDALNCLDAISVRIP